MTVAQWLFHYFEITKGKKEEVNLDVKKLKASLKTITEDIELLGLLIDGNKGIELMKIKSKIRDEAEMNIENKNESNSSPKQPQLNDADKELLEFFGSAPEFMEPTEEQDKVGRFFLPTVNIKEKMRLGFETDDEKILSEENTTIKENNLDYPELEVVEKKDEATNLGFGF